MPFIPDFDVLHNMIDDASNYSYKNEKLFWYDLLNYWNSLILSNNKDALKMSAYNWKTQFKLHFKDEDTIAKDVADIIVEYFEDKKS